MNLPTWFYIAAWIAWAFMFVAIETLAILDPGKGDTLTEKVRLLLSLHPVVWFAGAGMAVWAVGHLWLKWR